MAELFPIVAQEDPEEIFTSLYARYPRKRGKTQGKKAVMKWIKLGKKRAWFHACLDNYLAQIEEDGTAPQYVKYFSTWATNIEDYDGPAEDPDSLAGMARAILSGEL